jgi:hypothetical protein
MLFIHLLDVTQPMRADGSFPHWATLPTVFFDVEDTSFKGMTLAALRAQAVECGGSDTGAFAFSINVKPFMPVREALESKLAVSSVGAQGGDGFFVLVRPAAAAPAAAADAAATRGTLEVARVRACAGGWRVACARACACVRLPICARTRPPRRAAAQPVRVRIGRCVRARAGVARVAAVLRARAGCGARCCVRAVCGAARCVVLRGVWCGVPPVARWCAQGALRRRARECAVCVARAHDCGAPAGVRVCMCARAVWGALCCSAPVAVLRAPQRPCCTRLRLCLCARVHVCHRMPVRTHRRRPHRTAAAQDQAAATTVPAAGPAMLLNPSVSLSGVTLNPAPVTVNSAPVTVNPAPIHNHHHIVIHNAPPREAAAQPAGDPERIAKLATVRMSAIDSPSTPAAVPKMLQQRLTAVSDKASTVSGKIKAMGHIKDWDWRNKLTSQCVARGACAPPA